MNMSGLDFLNPNNSITDMKNYVSVAVILA